MSSEKENWYRTGAVAKVLGTSPHKVRELAQAGLIESQVRNGYRYMPGREVEIIDDALHPLKRREEQNRAIEEALRRRLDRDAQANHRLKEGARSRAENAVHRLPERASYRDMCAAANAAIDEINAVCLHRRRIARELQSLALPYGATSAECEQAQDLARAALADSETVPVGATDGQLRRVHEGAIAQIVEQVIRAALEVLSGDDGDLAA